MEDENIKAIKEKIDSLFNILECIEEKISLQNKKFNSEIWDELYFLGLEIRKLDIININYRLQKKCFIPQHFQISKFQNVYVKKQKKKLLVSRLKLRIKLSIKQEELGFSKDMSLIYTGASVKLLNGVRCYYDFDYDVKIKEFEGIKINDFYRARNIGKKTVSELETICKKAGVNLNYE